MYEIIVDRFKESGKWYATETIEVPKNLAEFEYPTYVKNLYPVDTTGFVTIFPEMQKDETIKNLLNCPMLICL